MADDLPVYVIFRRPLDFPNSLVVRRQVITPTGQIAMDPLPLALIRADDPNALAMARSTIPPGLIRLTDPNPYILEVWF